MTRSLILVLSVVIFFASALSVAYFERESNDAQHAQIAVTKLRVILEQFEKLNIEFQLEPARYAEFGAQINIYMKDAQNLLDELANLAPGSEQQHLQLTFTALKNVVNEARRLSFTRPTAVQTYVDEVGGPVRNAFGETLRSSEVTYSNLAARQHRIAWFGMWGVFGFAAICSGALLALNEHLRRKATRLLLRNQAQFRAMVQYGADLISVVDRNGFISFQSPSIAQVLGHQPAQIENTRLSELVSPEDQHLIENLLRDAKDHPGSPSKSEIRFRHQDGSIRILEVIANSLLNNPDVSGYVLTSRDVTTRNQQTELIAHQAMHDALTGLPNRRLLDDRLTQCLARAVRTAEPCALLFLDLDDFKEINDTFGHEVGDAALKLIAQRIVNAVRPGDTVARLGGDEFVVLLESAGAREAFIVADRVASAVSLPIETASLRMTVSTSIGISTRESAFDQPEELLRRADLAMYAGKRSGDTAPVIYSESIDRAVNQGADLPTAEFALL